MNDNKNTFDEEFLLGLTEKQRNAVRVYGCDVLVSAAAGSGKTYTLTKRIIYNIIKRNADISRMLIVTFTRAAASELRTKISSALIEAVAENPDNEHLRRQLLLIGGADICTIDSFLLRPVKENFEKLGLPASLRLADDAEMNPLKSELLAKTLDSFYERYGICADGKLADIELESSFTDLLFLFSTLKDSSDVEKYLLELYSTLITAPEGIDRLRMLSEQLSEDADRDFLKTPQGKVALDRLEGIIKDTQNLCDSQRPILSADKLLREKYLPSLDEDYNFCNLLLTTMSGGYSRVKACLEAMPSSRLKVIYDKDKTPESIYYANARKSVFISPMTDIKNQIFSYSAEEISHAYRRTASVTRVLYELLYEYDKALMSEKQSRGIAEFSDMPRYMMRLLLDENGEKSEACRQIAESFDEIYIDEYQDVNGIQDKIFELLSRNNRFMVGDIKQSIYAFREAEPTCFASYRERFTEYSEDDDSASIHGASVTMSNNFRSTESVIDFSNTICSPLFYACGNVISYTKADDLVFTKNCGEGYIPHTVSVDIFAKGDPDDLRTHIPHARVNVTADPDDPVESELGEEATFVANEICRLIREEKNLNGKPMRASDIAILIRKNKSIPIITKALDKAGIRYAVSSKASLLGSRNMSCLVDLLTVINNPRSDVPLCNVMQCESLEIQHLFSFGELITLRQFSGDGVSLYDSICGYSQGDEYLLPSPLREKCKALKQKLTDLRALSVKLSIEQFLRVLASDDMFAPLARGEEFKILYSCACDYIKTSWNTLGNFVRHFKKIIATGSLKGEIDSSADAVTITTMHSSKGLQYKACFLFDCSRATNLDDMSEAIVYDKELGVAIKIPERMGDGISPDAVSVEKKTNILHTVVGMNMARRLYQEEMRILYVALTRAEERLYITASIPKGSHFGSFANNMQNYGLSDISIREQSNMISWIIGTMMLKDHDRSRYTLTLHSIFNNTPLTEPLSTAENHSVSTATELEKYYASLMLDPPSKDPAELLLSSIPAKAAASKASADMLDRTVFSSIPDGVLFSDADDHSISEPTADSEESLRSRIELMMSEHSFDSLLEDTAEASASDKGTAMHLFLQYCDYDKVGSNSVEKEIERLVDNEFIDAQTAALLNVEQLKGFFNSKLFAIIKAAKNVRREFRFRLFRQASDFTQKESIAELVRDRRILIQGSIDLVIENSDGSIYLCDYKTDRISGAERAHPELLRSRLKARHKHQLDQYSYAIEKMLKHPPTKTFIFSLALGEALEI